MRETTSNGKYLFARHWRSLAKSIIPGRNGDSFFADQKLKFDGKRNGYGEYFIAPSFALFSICWHSTRARFSFQKYITFGKHTHYTQPRQIKQMIKMSFVLFHVRGFSFFRFGSPPHLTINRKRTAVSTFGIESILPPHRGGG